MLQQLLNHSPDLQKLVAEGYELGLSKSHNHLLVKGVPYLNAKKEVAIGTLVCKLDVAGNQTAQPGDHVAYFIGEYPCCEDGTEVTGMKNSSPPADVDTGLHVDHTFSAKPTTPYPDFYAKVTTYIAKISGPVQFIDPAATARNFNVIEDADDESVFHYIDTASSRAQISALNEKFESQKVAIVGVGGTGSYVLDFVSKTWVKEIRLFDADVFSQHNAFRCPGAASVEDLKAKPSKVEYMASIYARLRRGVIPHPELLTEANIDQLREMSFVFLCIDSGKAKLPIIEKLEEWGISFVDVGMGIELVDGALTGIVRLTTSTPAMRDHIRTKDRISFNDPMEGNEYATNIQVVELNALNAALAVIKWKKISGFYADLERENFMAYALSGNSIINEDQA